jgi:hypothetical protein
MNTSRHCCGGSRGAEQGATANPYANLTVRLETMRHDVPNRFT